MALKGSKTTTSFIPWDTLFVLLNKLENDKNYKFVMIVGLGVFTGLRISDVKRITWNHILNKDTLKITETKTKKYRIIPITKSLSEITSRIYQLANIRNPNELIVINKFGKPLSTQYINAQLKKIFAKYNYSTENVSTHLFRKTLGRKVWEQDNYSEKSLVLLSEIFNHSSIGITKKYLGINQSEIKNVYDMLSF